MAVIVLWAVLLAAPFCVFAQAWSGIIDSTRAIDWTTVGATIQTRNTICTTVSMTAGSSAAATNSTAINSAILGCTSGQVVFIPTGTWYINAIDYQNLSNITVRGAGPDKTILLTQTDLNCTGFGAIVCMVIADASDARDGPSNIGTWTAGYAVGTTSITIGAVTTGNISNLHVNSIIWLDQCNDGLSGATCTTGTATDTGNIFVCAVIGTCSLEVDSLNGRSQRGQVQPETVVSITGSGPWTVVVTPALRMPNVASGNTPGAYWNNNTPITGDGLESLTIDCTTACSGSTPGGIVLMFGASGNWVKNVRFLNAYHKHVWMYQSIHNTIRDSYFYGTQAAAAESYGTDTYNGADNLTENNIFQHVAGPMNSEGCIGCVDGYNFSLDDYYTPSNGNWQQASGPYHHSIGDAYVLGEGNEGIGQTSDDVHGSSHFMTYFRNYHNGRDTALTLGNPKTQQTNAVIDMAYSRYHNIIGNVLGTSTYHTNYQVHPANATDAGNSTTSDASIYQIGFSGNEGVFCNLCATGGVSLNNDTFVFTSMMRWGNYDTVTAAVRWCGNSGNPGWSTTCASTSEVPTGLSIYSNPVPASLTLPASFYLPAKPPFWSTPWGTPAYPPTGPDVTSGNISNVGGFANHIPAELCYANSGIDSNYPGAADRGVLLFNANTCYGVAGNGPQTVPPGRAHLLLAELPLPRIMPGGGLQ